MTELIVNKKRDYINTHFLKRVSYLMMYCGFTKAETARKANIARSTFYRYLDGEIPLNEHSISKIAHAFNLDWDIFGKEEFTIKEYDSETNAWLVKHCKWSDDDTKFDNLDIISKPSTNTVLIDETNRQISQIVNKLNDLVKSHPSEEKRIITTLLNTIDYLTSKYNQTIDINTTLKDKKENHKAYMIDLQNLVTGNDVFWLDSIYDCANLVANLREKKQFCRNGVDKYFGNIYYNGKLEYKIAWNDCFLNSRSKDEIAFLNIEDGQMDVRF